MKNLEVNLGFDQVSDDHTCEGKNISPRIEVCDVNATSMAAIVRRSGCFVGRIHSLDNVEHRAGRGHTGSNPYCTLRRQAHQGLAGQERLRKNRLSGALSASGKAAPVCLPDFWPGQDAGPRARLHQASAGDGHERPCAAAGRGHGDLRAVDGKVKCQALIESSRF